MALPCFKNCGMTKCPRFCRCPEHWDAEELAAMAPAAIAIAPPARPDWVEPELEEEKR